MHRTLLAAVLLLVAPIATAHGALELNEFDIYAISDFEGHEESFAWEGWEIWDVYVGDGYSSAHGAHGVYFKVNFAGDGELRPTGGQVWEVRFTWKVGSEAFERSISHDGNDVTTDFEELEWQVADGNVFQVRAWAPVQDWQGQSITDLVVLSLVDGSARDIAPGGIYDPATGSEIPVHVPPTPIFPEMGEGRIVDKVELTGPGKFLNVTVTPGGDGVFGFTVRNPLAAQGQHFMFMTHNVTGWTLDGKPSSVSVDGGQETTFQLRLSAVQETGVVAPLRFDLVTDIGGLRAFYAYQTDGGVVLTEDPSMALPYAIEEPMVESPGVPAMLLLASLALLARRRR